MSCTTKSDAPVLRAARSWLAGIPLARQWCFWSGEDGKRKRVGSRRVREGRGGWSGSISGGVAKVCVVRVTRSVQRGPGEARKVPKCLRVPKRTGEGQSEIRVVKRSLRGVRKDASA